MNLPSLPNQWWIHAQAKTRLFFHQMEWNGMEGGGPNISFQLTKIVASWTELIRLVHSNIPWPAAIASPLPTFKKRHTQYLAMSCISFPYFRGGIHTLSHIFPVICCRAERSYRCQSRPAIMTSQRSVGSETSLAGSGTRRRFMSPLPGQQLITE